MDENLIKKLLESVRDGGTTIDSAVRTLRHLPFEDLGFAKVDHHRSIRCGFPEVIYAEGKTTAQVLAIAGRRCAGGGNLLITRVSKAQADALRRKYRQAQHNESARIVTIRQRPTEPRPGYVAIVCAGTSDLPVAEEARETCEIMDQPTRSFYDVGVAGIHRLLAHSADLQQAKAVVVCAGMEGALPSVVGGLVACPVIGVPTSVGYGAHFAGLAPLLTMLNSCASGVCVVNIDNGFGAGYLAALIGRQSDAHPAAEPAMGGTRKSTRPRRRTTR